METLSVKMKNASNNLIRFSIFFLIFIISGFDVYAQTELTQKSSATVFSNPLFLGMLSIVILLLIIIVVLGNVVKAAAHHKMEMEKSKKNGNVKSILLLLISIFSFESLLAENISVKTVTTNLYWGLDGFTFYFMLIIISLELIVTGFLYVSIMNLLERDSEVKDVIVEGKPKIKEPAFLDKLNASVAVEMEKDILLDHNYDGIQELDNALPPWWKYGFYLTIIIGIIYLLNFHVFKTGKLQIAEYEEQISIAKSEQDALNKNNANTIDENNIKLITDEGAITNAKSLYLMNCAACHGKLGEGVVGPNLTDEYWIHGGNINDIFKSIKYGWPDKGMKAWQQDFSAKQLQEISSYVKLLKGTNPPNPKEKQGDLFIEETVKDSVLTKAVPDTMPQKKEI